jgi:hypothetical protein
MVSPVGVRFDEDTIWVGLSDGRVLGVPMAWFPRLMAADAAAREAYELSPMGIHWQRLDEDISVVGLLAGRGDMRWVGRLG